MTSTQARRAPGFPELLLVDEFGVVDEFGCRVPAFSTLSTPSTVLVSNCSESSLIWHDLASRRFWYAICFGEECNRVTDAPESTRRLSGHISPQPSSVPTQARQ